MFRAKTGFLAIAFCATAFGQAPTIVGSLTINNTLGGNHTSGQNWSLSLTGGQPDIPFQFCYLRNREEGKCLENFGRTDQNGNWKYAGSFDFTSVGDWTQWIKYPSGAVSNRIVFRVDGATMGNLSINNALGGNFAIGQAWTLTLTGAPSNTSFKFCAAFENKAPSCTDNFGTTNANGAWTMPGTFPVWSAGGWTEWADFPSGYSTNRISFTVGTAISYLTFGLDLGPYTGSQDPNTNITIPESQLVERISKIAPFTQWLRIYGATNGLENVGKIANDYGVKLVRGIWLNNNTFTNDQQIAAALDADKSISAGMIVVGSEVLYRKDLGESELIAYLRKVKQAAPQAIVTTADTFSALLNHPNVVAACDVIMANNFPYWNGISINQAIASLNADYEILKSRYPQKEIYIAETGWPSAGNTIGNAVPSPQNAAFYFLNFVSWARALNRKYFYFEAFDEPWKAAYEGPQGSHWGVWDTTGALKPGMLDVFSGKTTPDNWSGSDFLLPGGAGAPTIQFTVVPPKGSSQDLQGQVLHLKPADYYVAVYIRVNGGWWTKPYWTEPATKINFDGSWVCDITTGGLDSSADQIVAYVVRATYKIPLAGGEPSLPNLGENAVATATVNR